MKSRIESVFGPRPGGPNPLGSGRRYSRFVYRTKLTLPAVAGALLLLVAAWPRLQGAFVSVRFPVPHIDLSDARDLHMANARFTGVDRQDRPFTITADTARQKPDLNGLVTLERPKGDLTTVAGNWLELSANSGLYQPQQQLLDLYGEVALFQDKGNEFHTASAHVNMEAGTAEGDQPVTGQGPFGDVAADGFRILDRGDTIIFKGHATLAIEPRGTQNP